MKKPEKANSQEWMTRDETQRWLNVSIRTVDNFMVDGTLPFYKRGAVVRFNRAECAAALKKFRHKSRWDTAGDEEEGL
jgi:excisionase family DNA binding protein